MQKVSGSMVVIGSWVGLARKHFGLLVHHSVVYFLLCLLNLFELHNTFFVHGVCSFSAYDIWSKKGPFTQAHHTLNCWSFVRQFLLKVTEDLSFRHCSSQGDFSC